MNVLNFLITLFTFFISIERSYSESVEDDKLKVCKKNEQCECKLPNLTVKENFKIPPKYLSKEIISCNLLSFDLKRNLECLSFKDQNFKFSCLAIKENICQDPYRIPLTYNPSLKAKKNCGYKWKNFRMTPYRAMLKDWIDKDILKCQYSMCVTAVHLALVAHAKKKYSNGQITKEQYEDIITPNSLAYNLLNENAEPNELVEKYNLGTGHIIHLNKKNLDNVSSLSKGDIVQIWRKSHSGHSVIFKGLLDEDNDGKSDLFCYWSSQKKTNGFGNVCEPINKISRLLIGHLQ